MFRAMKQVWNDDVVQVRTKPGGCGEVGIGFPHADSEPFIFRVAEGTDIEKVKASLLTWLRAHIVDSGGKQP